MSDTFSPIGRRYEWRIADIATDLMAFVNGSYDCDVSDLIDRASWLRHRIYKWEPSRFANMQRTEDALKEFCVQALMAFFAHILNTGFGVSSDIDVNMETNK